MDLLELARNFAGFFIVLLFSLCFHEFAHGIVAKFKGDNTAETMGRLTMNPTSHMDPIGTVMLPMMTIFFNTTSGANLPLFGWAKPVPVNIRNLKNPRSDMFWIALAGPGSNVLLAIVGTILLVLAQSALVTTDYITGVRSFLAQFIVTNLFLAFFNIIPLHPLDGGKVLARFLPAELNYKLEQNEHITSMLLLVVIVAGGLQFLAIPVILTYRYLLSFAGVF